jgi:uncharacterized cupredoxin-like copper-binding protein
MIDRRRVLIAGSIAAALAAKSTLGVAAIAGAFRGGWVSPSGECTAPTFPGALVDVTLADMGASMMRNATGGHMRIFASQSTVTAGDVSLRVANTGSIVHELIVLPLPAGQRIGHREVKSDGRVDETGSLGEAAKPCGDGAGDGIDPGGLSWTTLQLRPGTYEMLCNIPGHYAAGMYRTLVVS